MKIIVSALLLCVGITVSSGQEIIRKQDIEAIKNSKLIVGLTGDQDIDNDFRKAIEDHWRITAVVDYLPVKEAIAKAKEDESYAVIKLGEKKSVSRKHSSGFNNQSYRYVSTGQVIEIRGKKANAFASTYIPQYKDNETAPEILQFAIASLQYNLMLMDERGLNNNLGLKKVYKEKSAELNNKTLLIPEGWLSSKMTAQEVKSLYNGKIKVVDYDEWSSAIMDKDENSAYLMIVPIPSGGNFVYYHYIMNPVNGQVYGVAYPKVAASVSGVNVSGSNSGFVTSKMVKMYNDIPTGKW